MKFILALFLLCSCSQERHEEKEPAPDDRVAQLADLHAMRRARAEVIRDSSGWLTPANCDGMQMTALYAASPGVTGVDLSAAQYPAAVGRYTRRPIYSGLCYDEDEPDEAKRDKGAATTWSRDMGLPLMIAWWRARALAPLEAHISYGEAHPGVLAGLPAWRMGEPLADGRVLYSPAMVAAAYQVAFALGGADRAARHIGNIYPPGLTDFEAFLQVLGILVRAEVAEARGEVGEIPRKPENGGDNPLKLQYEFGATGAQNAHNSETYDEYAGVLPPPSGENATAMVDISDSMYSRLEEHHAREPADPLYAYMVGVYSGDLGPALTVCLREDMPLGSYAHCTEEACRLSYWLFACGNVLHRFGVL